VRSQHLFKFSNRYRWVYCQLATLRRCIPSTIPHVLSELPVSLDETYERVLKAIPRSIVDHAHRLLQCLVAAVRPLRIEELAEVLAVDLIADGVPELKDNWRWEDQGEAVLSTCSSLIAIVHDGHSRMVQFSHFSVREFLTSERLASASPSASSYFHVSLGLAHTVMVQVCLSVLLRLDSDIDEATIEGSPLVEYAVQYWADHAEFEGVLSHVPHAVDVFLNADHHHFAVWLWLSRSIHSLSLRTETRPTPLEAAPLYYMAGRGFLGLVRHLVLGRPQDVHARAGPYGTPLHAALHEGHVEVFRLLLQHCRDEHVDVRDFQGQTTFHVAASDGLLDVIQMLLEHNADMNVRDNVGETPLHGILEYINYKVADSDSFFDVIRFLLKHGADVDAQNDTHWTPLHRASCCGSIRATDLLLGHNANVHARNNEGRTALHYAMQSEVARLLLKHGAEVDAQDGDGSTALHVASSEGKFEVAKLLLNSGANVHVRNKNSQIASEVALARGYQAIEQLLLRHMENEA
jgi:ankyrin repeat protein